MQNVILTLIDIVTRGLDSNISLYLKKNVSSKKYPSIAVTAVKNKRKKMEDRHVVVNDFNYVFSLEVCRVFNIFLITN